MGIQDEIVITETRTLGSSEAEPGVQVEINATALEKMINYGNRYPNTEAGGVMLAKKNGDQIQITEFVQIPDALLNSDLGSVNISSEAWAAMWREIDQINSQRKDESKLFMAGWFHTHPGWGCFLSSPDQYIHNGFFAQKGQLAAVYDPQRKDLVFWKNVAENEAPQTVFSKTRSNLIYPGSNDVTIVPLGGLNVSGEDLSICDQITYPTPQSFDNLGISIVEDNATIVVNVNEEDVKIRLVEKTEKIQNPDGSTATLISYDDGTFALDINTDQEPDIEITYFDLLIMEAINKVKNKLNIS